MASYFEDLLSMLGLGSEIEERSYMAQERADQRSEHSVKRVKLSKEELYKLSEEFGDMEWQQEVAPYVEDAEIDVSKARFHGLPDEPNQSLTLAGYSLPEGQGDGESMEYRSRDTGKKYAFPQDAGTVNVIGAGAAVPAVWGHEYRHQEDKEGGRGGEYDNRKKDLLYAQDKKDWDRAVDVMLRYMARSDEKIVELYNEGTPEEKEQHIIDFIGRENSLSQVKDGEGAMWKLRKAQLRAEKDSGAVQMPEDYRAGGNVKLI